MKDFRRGDRDAREKGSVWRRKASHYGYLLVLFTVAVAACGKRPPPPLPPPPEARVPAPAPEPDATPREGVVAAPQLTVFVEPEEIAPGESALLTWESKGATRVWIEPNIGDVDTSGRIRFFPDRTTSYTVSAEGPGGRISREVQVQVGPRLTPGGDQDVREEELEAVPLERRFEEEVRPVFFPFDSAELTEEAKLVLEANLRWLMRSENRHVRVRLEGHTDQRGSEEYNLALGDRRAQVVRDYLISRGMDPNRLETFSWGEEKPRVPGTTEEAYAQNRRTEFVLLGRVSQEDSDGS